MDRSANTIRARPVPETAKARPRHSAGSGIVKGSKTYADWNGACGCPANHEAANCVEGEYVLGDVRVNGTESFCARVRRCGGTG